MEYNGEWKNVLFAGFQIPYLYLLGDEIEHLTGGWITDGYTMHQNIPVGGNIQKLSDSILLTVNTTNDRTGIIIGTNEIFSVANYNKITLEYLWGGTEYTLELDISSISSGYVNIYLDNYVLTSGHLITVYLNISGSKTYVSDNGKQIYNRVNYSSDLLSVVIKKVYL